jgi:hypothetical protein
MKRKKFVVPYAKKPGDSETKVEEKKAPTKQIETKVETKPEIKTPAVAVKTPTVVTKFKPPKIATKIEHGTTKEEKKEENIDEAEIQYWSVMFENSPF